MVKLRTGKLGRCLEYLTAARTETSKLEELDIIKRAVQGRITLYEMR
jgi:hypothetical protein